MRDSRCETRVEPPYTPGNEIEPAGRFAFVAPRPQELHAEAQPQHRPTGIGEPPDGIAQSPLGHATHGRVERADAGDHQVRDALQLLRRRYEAAVVPETGDRVGYGAQIPHIQVQDADEIVAHFSRYHWS